MTVKPVRAAERTLAVLEVLAEHQPVGVGALARLLDDDKSAVQRALVTLAGTGWIRPVAGDQTRWELTGRVLVVAQHAQHRSDLRQRARPVLEELRDEVDESVLLVVPDVGRLVVIDVVESRQLVRTAPWVGMVIPPTTSAAGRAYLAAIDDEERRERLDGEPPAQLRRELDEVRARGWSLNAGDVVPNASGVGAAILGGDGRPVGVIAISAPSERMPAEVRPRLGRRVAEVAAALSDPGAPAS